MRLLLISFLLVSGFCLSQEVGDATKRFGSFRAGLKVGLVASQIDGDNYGGYNKAGLTGGILINTSLNQRLDAQMEIGYSNRGSRDPADPDNAKFTSYRINLHYIDIPLLIRFQTWKFKFEVGLTNGILVGSKEEDHNGLITNSIFNFKRYELALNLGANILLTPGWTFNVRYHRSILPIANELTLVPKFGLFGGSYNDALTFTFIRYLNPQN